MVILLVIVVVLVLGYVGLRIWDWWRNRDDDPPNGSVTGGDEQKVLGALLDRAAALY